MKWEQKIELVKLGNQRNNNEETHKIFLNYVLQHVTDFDLQAWDMFSNLVEITFDKMKEDIDFWKEIYPYMNRDKFADNNLNFRSSLRLFMIIEIMEDHFK